MQVSVIIPFRGNLSTLHWVLEGFALQNLPADLSLDIRIGRDGPDVPAVAPPIPVSPHIQFTTLAFPRVGVCETRNRLLQDATGEIVIFANSDTRPRPDFVTAHVTRLLSLPHGSMVVGASPYVTATSPAPSAETVFDVLKRDTPMIFFYANLQPNQWYDYRHAWSLNLSARRADVTAAGNFQPLLRPVFYDDIEMAYRIMGDQKRVYFEPRAIVEHFHPMTFESYLMREELLGLMAPVLFTLNPAIAASLFAHKSLATLETEFSAWVKMDAPAHAFTLSRMSEWIDLPSTALGTGEPRTRLLATLYQMHIPLKRLAFRLGFLRGLTLRDDTLWQERQPQGLWKQITNTT